MIYQQQPLFNLNHYNALPVRFREVNIGQQFRTATYHAASNSYSRGERIFTKITDSLCHNDSEPGDDPHEFRDEYLVFIIHTQEQS